VALAAACAHPAQHRASAAPALAAPPDVPWESTLLLVGDAGEPGSKSGGAPEPVLRAAARVLARASGQRAVVFLGDNVYPDGYPPPPRRADDSLSAEVRRARAILDGQVRLAGPADGPDAVPRTLPRWFVPGNHDWNDHTLLGALFRKRGSGESRARAQDAYLRAVAAAGDSVAMLPAAGCPGPETRDVGRWLRVIAIDTQWWLQRPRVPAGACGGVTTRALAAERLRQALATAGERRVIVVAHHPLATAGPHGGRCGNPLGCLARSARLAGGYLRGRQDISNRRYAAMRAALESALRDRRPLAFVAGHEHALQVFRGGVADWYLGSGSGIWRHTSKVGCRAASAFALGESGFMRLDAAADGRVRLTVLTAGRDGVPVERYRRWLTDSAGAAGEGANC
jgi:hypothetical protein